MDKFLELMQKAKDKSMTLTEYLQQNPSEMQMLAPPIMNQIQSTMGWSDDQLQQIKNNVNNITNNSSPPTDSANKNHGTVESTIVATPPKKWYEKAGENIADFISGTPAGLVQPIISPINNHFFNKGLNIYIKQNGQVELLETHDSNRTGNEVLKQSPTNTGYTIVTSNDTNAEELAKSLGFQNANDFKNFISSYEITTKKKFNLNEPDEQAYKLGLGAGKIGGQILTTLAASSLKIPALVGSGISTALQDMGESKNPQEMLKDQIIGAIVGKAFSTHGNLTDKMTGDIGKNFKVIRTHALKDIGKGAASSVTNYSLNQVADHMLSGKGMSNEDWQKVPAGLFNAAEKGVLTTAFSKTIPTIKSSIPTAKNSPRYINENISMGQILPDYFPSKRMAQNLAGRSKDQVTIADTQKLREQMVQDLSRKAEDWIRYKAMQSPSIGTGTAYDNAVWSTTRQQFQNYARDNLDTILENYAKNLKNSITNAGADTYGVDWNMGRLPAPSSYTD